MKQTAINQDHQLSREAARIHRTLSPITITLGILAVLMKVDGQGVPERDEDSA